MCRLDSAILRYGAVGLLLAGNLSTTTGCATLAHRSSYSYQGKQSATACEGRGTVCPWLIGDALLLVVGIVPGVIAFAVDFGTGAWRHDDFAATASTRDEKSGNMPRGDRQRPLDVVLFGTAAYDHPRDADSVAIADEARRVQGPTPHAGATHHAPKDGAFARNR